MKQVSVVVSFLVTISVAVAQHCAPLYESYLSEVTIKRVRAEKPSDDTIRIHAQYAKEGGDPPPAYQGYLIAYVDRAADKVPAAAPADIIDPKAALVLHTQLMKLHSPGSSALDASGRGNGSEKAEDVPWTYDLDFEIRCEELADKVIAHAKLGEKDREDWTNWYHYKDHIRFALFVPWLDDAKYSVMEGLREDRHECNYFDDRALLFQELPFRVRVLTSRSKTTRGRVWLQVNSERAAPPKEEPKEAPKETPKEAEKPAEKRK
ncbi:MAG: hypothetical protein KDC48_09160 [Planctomycetes bacterium]|nr:hypothetical protein [Planctomycetota bacterium]